ncbi:MAG: sirohydrochlorin chelatase [Puniceicoccaceae bacterium]
MRYLLVDNGSLRPQSVLNLRSIAAELSRETGLEILPSSLLHSSKVPVDQLEGEPAVNLERRLRLFLEAGERNFTILPFFFGPTGAITEYLPQRLAYRREKHGDFNVRLAPFLFLGDDQDNSDLVQILADNVGQVMSYNGWKQPRVILVDHGSPLPAVTDARNALAVELESMLGGAVAGVAPASMERREGEAYAFNEPLLENILRQPPWNDGPVVVSMLFLSPGRHAGPGGDIATICREAREKNPGLRTSMTGLVGEHPGIIAVLKRRLEMGSVEI